MQGPSRRGWRAGTERRLYRYRLIVHNGVAIDWEEA